MEATEAIKESKVFQQINILDHTIGELSAILEILRNRLHPILEAYIPATEIEKPVLDTIHSVVVERMNTQIRELNYLITLSNEIINHLEL